MQKILCIDVSSNPAVATLVGLEAKSISLLEQHSADLGGLFHAKKEYFSPDLEQVKLEQDLGESGNQHLLELATFRELLNRFSASWTSSLMVISGSEYISLDLKLPFSTSREISKIIGLEVQDQVPFDIADFVIDHCVLNQSSSAQLNDIHVGLLPRKYLAKIMSACKACEFDPVVVTTPASAMGALSALMPDYFTADCAILYLTSDACYSCVIFDGSIRSDRVFMNNWLAATENQQLYQELLKEFKIYLTGLENRFGRNVEKIYVIQANTPSSVLQNALGRNVLLLDTSDIMPAATSAATVLTCAASVFVRDIQPVRPLSNFRTQEFAFRPQLKNLYSGLQALTKYLLLSFALLIVMLVVKLASDTWQAQSIRNSIASQIKKLAPELDSETQNNITAINQLTTNLEAELTSLGSPSRFTAIDVLSQMTKDLRKLNAIDITNLRITGNRVLLGGNAQTYAQSDELRAIFRRHKDMYCDVTRDTSASSGGTRAFQYSLELCG